MTQGPDQPTKTVPVADLPLPTWEEIGLSTELRALVEKAGFTKPTPIQTQSIPAGLGGKDLLASAQTGTGKTFSFVAPMIEKFMGRKGTYGLVLCPTREIAQQTHECLEIFGKPLGIDAAVLIGGVEMRLDLEALRNYPNVIVATPGRLCDHLDRGNVWLDYIEFLILDEADRMLDMGFSTQLNRIMESVPASSQKLCFSATIPPEVDKLARKFMKDPVRIAVGKAVSTATTVEQKFIYVPEDEKIRALKYFLKQEPGSTIVFVRSKETAAKLWQQLHSGGIHDATTIHSNLMQQHREQALASFKSGESRIMIATDVAGRGIHVDEVAHVINYEMPMEAEDYVHRIGRTGRAEASGKATSFASERDRGILKDIGKIIGKQIQVEDAPANFWTSPSSSGRGRPSSGGGRGGPRRR